MPVKYPTATEQIYLGSVDVPPAARQKARSVCASSRSKFEYLRVDVCASVKGGASLKIESSREIAKFMRTFLEPVVLLQEHFGVLSLDATNTVIGFAIVHKGGLSSAIVEMPVVFKPALLLPTQAVVLVHNHPSGNTKPSDADVQLTKRAVEVGKLLGIPVLDHIILGEGSSYFSFVDAGIMGR